MSVAADDVVLRVPDPGKTLRGVRLRTDLFKRGDPPAFSREGDGGGWVLRLQRPSTVARIEYLLELEDEDGTTTLAPDAANPLRVPGPFGARSVLELPEYRLPGWVEDHEAPAGRLRALHLRSRRLRAETGGLLWEPPGVDPSEPLPLLVAHDGPEYAEYSLLTRFLESMTAELELPPLRAALLQPIERDEHYSASARYATALVRELIPALERIAPTPRDRSARVGMGASLGALAMLHAHRMHPESFGALFLQSGSFFRQRSDRQESGFGRFRRITRFVGTVLGERSWPQPVPIAMTCGTGEENLHNNRAIRDALAAQGYTAALDEHPDAHNWVSWRDTFDPHLLVFLQRLWD